ncbi:phosphoribosylglycinamide formyltransferase [Pinisolibacter aquiterrae]|uniref:phosphoribosylglycinamide formyltransferase n=1 Tax=Pinisolibacter aquiterrae TaxID=2815579 RepID=UPI0030846E98|nr:phosphoribosylglycinamide formyltransferase [Pinisolibacter aquiterrae]
MTTLGRRRVGILISGGGSNMAALIAAARDPAYPAEIVCVISNRADAGGLAKAEAAGIATLVVDHKAYDGREAFERAVVERLEAHGVELVVLAGFMRLLTPWFIERWHDRLINIHPALLPSYKGLHTHERALADGVKIAGCTVHFVRPEMDVGPIIVQAAVPVLDDDTPDTLAARVLVQEHRIYPLALARVASGAARVVQDAEGRERVETRLPSPPAEALISPR